TGDALGWQEQTHGAGECWPSPCTYTITALRKGTPYHVRVHSYNSFGYSARPALSEPRALAPVAVAQPPVRVDVVPAAEDVLRVTFPPSADDGGAPVTRYRVEWDALGDAAVAAGASEAMYAVQEVQAITTAATEADLGGEFVLAFEGKRTQALPFDASATEVRQALQALPSLGAVHVTRRREGVGLRWVVTFLGNPGAVPLLQVSTDGGATLATLAT
ncbi:MAG: fibronectin type III domain-containing protein, partial [Hylemonella sp.]